MYHHIESRDPFFQHHMCLSRNLLYRIRFSNNTCVFNFTYPHRESGDPFFQQHMYLEGLLGILFLGELWINFPSASRDPYVWTWFFVHQSSLSIRPSILILFHYSFPFSVLGLLGWQVLGKALIFLPSVSLTFLTVHVSCFGQCNLSSTSI